MTTHEEDVDVFDVLDRVKTGVNAFDELVMGGLPRGRATVVGGTPGSGKTVFATQFLAHGITTFGENGVLVTFEEPPSDIEANMRGFGWDLPAWRKQGRLAFVDASPSASDELVVGDYDLAGLLARIDHAVKTVKARRVVLDSLTQLFDHFIGDPKILRRELFRISSALKKSRLTVLMTAERNNEYGEITRHRLEEFVADNVVILRNVLHREKRRRTIEVLKMRGSHHAEGEAPFTLLENRGVVAVPLSSLRLEQQSSMIRVTSGNPSIDEMCGGGFFRDSVTLVSGATGTGKTLLVTNFLAGGVAAGEKAILFGYEESKGQLFRNATGWGVAINVHMSGPALLISVMTLFAAAYLTLISNYYLERDARRSYLHGLRDRLRHAEADAAAKRDALTELGNRNFLAARVEELWGVTGERDADVGVILLDIDHFKLFNDRYGHGAGDLCLKRVAACVSAELRGEEDTAIRYGGEEILALLPGADMRTAIRVAERIRRTVEAFAIPHEGLGPWKVVTASLGVAVGPVARISSTELIAAADAALYAAKRNGRNQVWPPLLKGSEGRDEGGQAAIVAIARK